MLYCSELKECGALLFSGEENWCTTTVLKYKKTDAPLLMFSGEGDW